MITLNRITHEVGGWPNDKIVFLLCFPGAAGWEVVWLPAPFLVAGLCSVDALGGAVGWEMGWCCLVAFHAFIVACVVVGSHPGV